MDTRILLHAPDLQQKDRRQWLEWISEFDMQYINKRAGIQTADLERHVVWAGGQQAARGIPLYGIHFILHEHDLDSNKEHVISIRDAEEKRHQLF